MKIELFIQTEMVTKAALICAYLALLVNSAKSQDAEDIFQRGNSLSADGKYQEALLYVDSSLHIDSTLYQRYGFRAELKVKMGMIESAINDITKCIERCHCSTRKYHVSSYYLERAEMQLLNNNHSAAMSDVNKSISSNPNWRAYNFRSRLLFISGDLQGALKDLDKSINIDDNQSETFIARAKLRIEIGDLSGACSDLSKVVSWGLDQYEPWINANCK